MNNIENFIFDAGKTYQIDYTSAHNKKVNLKFQIDRSAWVGSFIWFIRRESCHFARPLFFPGILCTLDKNSTIKRNSFHGEMTYPLSSSLGYCSSLTHSNVHSKQRFRARTNCFISSDGSHRLGRRKMESLGISGDLHDQLVYHLPATTRANFKSEQYGVPETQLDSLSSSEVSGEAVLIGANVTEVSPWWEQFPKRWVIVLLCFFAFLLCNMDRVFPLFWFPNEF